MKLSHKLLTILLAGIVVFSSGGISSYASQTTGSNQSKTQTTGGSGSSTATGTAGEDASEEDGENGADIEAEIPEIPVESNEIDGWPQGPQVSAESAIVMEAQTGTILYAKNIDAAEYPASITKIMTVLLALENCSMDETVTFSENAVFSIERGSSHIARTTDEELTMEQCLYAIMLESANECANAVAEHIAGSTEAFADMMNQKAADLGCTNTHFVNPHGLHDPEHYTSAHDMALITQAALKYDKFREIAGTVRYTIPPTNKNENELMMNNHHCMISTYKTSKYLDSTVFAGKTGFTTDALNTLVTCAHRSEMDVICVILRGPSGTAYPDTASLLDYVSNHFSPADLPAAYADLPDTVTSQISAQAGSSVDTANITLADGSNTYTAIPDGTTLADLTPQVSVQTGADSAPTAEIAWYYGANQDVCVGRQQLILPLIQTAAASDADSSLDVKLNQEEPRKSIPWGTLKIILIVLVVLVILGILVTGILLIHAKKEREKQRRRRARMRERNLRRIRREIDTMADLDDDTYTEEDPFSNL